MLVIIKKYNFVISLPQYCIIKLNQGKNIQHKKKKLLYDLKNLYKVEKYKKILNI